MTVFKIPSHVSCTYNVENYNYELPIIISTTLITIKICFIHFSRIQFTISKWHVWSVIIQPQDVQYRAFPHPEQAVGKM